MNKKLFVSSFLFVVLLTGCSKTSNGSKENSKLDQYIVVLNRSQIKLAENKSGGVVAATDVVYSMLNDLGDQHDLQVQRRFSVALQGGVYKMTEAQARSMAKDPLVAYVEKDHVVSINVVQSNVTWGLDRLDQTDLPLDQSYSYPASGVSVNAYVIDTGILTTHSDFQGRAFHGTDTADGDSDATDCNGHGTHVAGTIGSSTYGVAKNVKLYGVRVLDCSGSGRYSDVIAGVEWVTANHIKPAVANMSLGGSTSQAIDDAVNASIQAGVTYVLAAGNSNTSACNSSPARVDQAITVGSTTEDDSRSSFSNYGSCVDVFAPGSDILSTWYSSSNATNTISGTSMASPHVAGVAALYLSKNPNAEPSEVMSALLSGSVSGRVDNRGSGSPDLLINQLFLADDDGNGGGGDDDDGGSPELTNGLLVEGLTGRQGDEKRYTIQVPDNSSRLTFEMFGGDGDADIYVTYGEEPTLSSYDCRPYDVGNDESCNFEEPTPGVWHVMVRAYSTYSGVSLKVLYEIKPEEVNNSPCVDCEHYSGNLNETGDTGYHPDGGYYYSSAGTHKVWLGGPATADFDLHLYKYEEGSWKEVAKSVKSRSSEKINYNGESGYYQLKVLSYLGSGDYDLWRKVP